MSLLPFRLMGAGAVSKRTAIIDSMRLLISLVTVLTTSFAAEFDHSAWDRVLKRFVNDRGEIDYGGIRKDRADMEAYLTALRAASPKNKPELFPSKEAALAYWINAYNALVTHGVAIKYPVKSVRDLGLLFGFFRAKEYVAGGQTVSLDNIEHDTIRKEYREPRIHFAIVCASLGCPYLARDAYLPSRLEQQLDAAARAFFSQERNFAVVPAKNQVVLSKIFDWYGKDFGGTPGVLEFSKRYLPEARRKQFEAMKNPRVRFRDYDWSINDPGSRAREK